MAVRPFYIESDIDGRRTNLSGGPQSKTGGIETTIYQRSDGSIYTAFCIKSYASEMADGSVLLTTAIYDPDTGECLARKETKY